MLLVRRLPSRLHSKPILLQQSARSLAMASTNVSQAIIKDHDELREQYENIKKATDDDTKQRWTNQFIWELARHAVAEELVVYPAMEQYVPNGKQLAEKDRRQHQPIKESLYELEKLKPSDPAFAKILKQVGDNLAEHMVEEERDDLPALEKGLKDQPGKSEELSKSFQRTKFFVPTRSHPSAPAKPPFETVAGLLAAPIDHITDLFRKFPKN